MLPYNFGESKTSVSSLVSKVLYWPCPPLHLQVQLYLYGWNISASSLIFAESGQFIADETDFVHFEDFKLKVAKKSKLPSSITLSVSHESVLIELIFFSFSACFFLAVKTCSWQELRLNIWPTFHYQFPVRLCSSILSKNKVLGSTDPFNITSQLLLKLLLFLESHEPCSWLNSLFFFGKLSEKNKNNSIDKQCLQLFNGLKIWIVKFYPLSTPRTRLSMKKEPTTMSGMKKAQLNTFPIASLVYKQDQCIYCLLFGVITQGFTHPIQDWSPTFHCYTLKDC